MSLINIKSEFCFLKLLFLLPFFTNISIAQEVSFADGWEYAGVAVEEPGYTIWGSSPIMDDDGHVHLFVARWPAEYKVDPGWRSHSEIAHYISDSPEGPFIFSDIALKGLGPGHWDAFGVHNPAIHKVGNMYYLLYISNDNPKQPPHPTNQHIGLAKSKSLDGPWERIHGDGLILSPPNNPDYWNYKSSNGVNNPALLQHPGGGYFLYFKSEGSKMGLAIAENIEGPYVQLPYPVTYNNRSVEDGYAFMMDGKFCLLTTDNHGMLEKGGGILWSSKDGIRFTDAEPGFYPAVKYIDSSRLEKRVCYYGGGIVKFERPQVLLINDKPAYMYAPSGYNFFGGDATISYVLRRKADAIFNTLHNDDSDTSVSIISYNIWNGFDWGKDTARFKLFVSWIKAEDPDVIAFQELCGYNVERLKREAAMWGHNYVALLKESGYSVGLTSNKPIEIKEKLRQGLHHGALHAKTYGIDFLVVHLNPGSYAFRRTEFPVLLDKLNSIRQETDSYIVLGDFNSQSPLDVALYPDDGYYMKRVKKANADRPLKGNLVNGNAIDYTVIASFMGFPLVDLVEQANQAINERGSFPALVLSKAQNEPVNLLRKRLERIDFIFASPSIARGLKSAAVLRNSKTDWLSDHYPVKAVIAIHNSN